MGSIESGRLQWDPAGSTGIRRDPVGSGRIRWDPMGSGGISGIQWDPIDNERILRTVQDPAGSEHRSQREHAGKRRIPLESKAAADSSSWEPGKPESPGHRAGSKGMLADEQAGA